VQSDQELEGSMAVQSLPLRDASTGMTVSVMRWGLCRVDGLPRPESLCRQSGEYFQGRWPCKASPCGMPRPESLCG